MNAYPRTDNDYALIATAYAIVRNVDYGMVDTTEQAIDDVLADGIGHLEYTTPGMQDGNWIRVDRFYLTESEAPTLRALVAAIQSPAAPESRRQLWHVAYGEFWVERA